MRIVLRADIPNVGKRGDICDVADGFARNYLLPKGHAIKATEGVVSQAAAMRRAFSNPRSPVATAAISPG